MKLFATFSLVFAVAVSTLAQTVQNGSVMASAIETTKYALTIHRDQKGHLTASVIDLGVDKLPITANDNQAQATICFTGRTLNPIELIGAVNNPTKLLRLITGSKLRLRSGNVWLASKISLGKA